METLQTYLRDNCNMQELEKVAIRFTAFASTYQWTTMTYQQLFNFMTKVSALLKKHYGSNDVIGVVCQPGLSLPAMVLGILDAGCSFCPIDEQIPTQYMTHALNTIRIKALLVSESTLQRFMTLLDGIILDTIHIPHTDATVIRLITSRPASNPNIAYVITTSGTTGQPKTVYVPHRCILPNIKHLRDIYSISESDVMFLASPLTFDPGIVELMLCLSSGAQLIVVADEVKMNPRKLLHCLTNECDVTVLQCTPTLLNTLSATQPLSETLLSDSSKLRVLAVGGEMFPKMSSMKRSLGNRTRVFNLYGITEVSCWSLYHEVTDEEQSEVPLGKPLRDTDVCVKDKSGSIIQEGYGQLHVGGSTRSCFINNRFHTSNPTGDYVFVDDNGMIWYRGREDDQTKIHGKRLNLMEIEKVVLSLEFIQNAATVADDNVLYLFIRSNVDYKKTEETALNDDVKSHLSESLPDYYQPCFVIRVDHIPMTKHGKIDKAKLMLDFLSKKNNTIDDVRSTVTESIQEIFHEPVHSLELTKSFLELGGTSLKAVQLIERLEHKLQYTLTDGLDVLINKTVQQFIEYITNEKIQSALHSSEDQIGLEPKRRKIEETTTYKNITTRTVTSDTQDTQDTQDDVQKDTPENTSDVHAASRTVVQRGSQVRHSGDVRQTRVDSVDESDESNMRVSLTQVWRYNTGQCVDASPVLVDCSRHTVLDDSRRTLLDCSRHIVLDDSRHTVLDDSRHTVLDDSRHTVLDDSQHTVLDDSQHTVLDDSRRTVLDESRHTVLDESRHTVLDESRHTVLDDSRHIVLDDSQDLSDAQHSRATVEINDYRAETDTKCSRSATVVDESSPSIDTYDSRLSPHSTRSAPVMDDLRLSLHSTRLADDSPPSTDTHDSRALSVIYIGSHSHEFSCINLLSGVCIWSVQLEDRIESSASVSKCGQWVVVGCYAGYVYKIDRCTGAVLWRYKAGDAVKCSPCISPGGLCYVGSHDKHFYCLNLETEQCVWRTFAGTIFSSPAVDVKQVYCCTLSGQIHAFDNLTGISQWHDSIEKPIFSSPCFTPAGVCVGCVDGGLYCWSLDGCLIWKFQTQAPIFSSPVFWPCTPRNSLEATDLHNESSGLILCGSHDRNLYCLTDQGKMKWTFTAQSEVYSTPFVFTTYTAADCQTRSPGADVGEIGGSYRTLVCVCCTTGYLHILSITDGRLLTSTQLPGEVFSSPVIHKDTLVVGCRDNYVYGFKLKLEK